MLRITPWAALALSHLAHAQPDLFHTRSYTEECCPCSGSSAPNSNVKTITVTESTGTSHTITINAPPNYLPPKETITVHHTVTEPGSTIYVTSVAERTVTKEVTVVPVAANKPNGKYVETATITSGPTSPSEQAVKGYGVKYDSFEGDNRQHDRYVTITVSGGYGNEYERIKTITTTGPDGANIVKTLTVGGSNNDYQTKTIKVGDKYYATAIPVSSSQAIQDGKDYAVFIKPEPSTTTLVLGDGRTITQVVNVPHTITVISHQTVTQEVKEHQTITNNAAYRNGRTEVKIVVIDRETGESTCKTESGLPCYGSGSHADADSSGKGYGDASNNSTGSKKYDGLSNGGDNRHYVTATEAGAAMPTECPLMGHSTSVQTVYNTVVMTVGPNGDNAPKPTETAKNPAAAQPTDGRKMRIRRSGAQLPAWW